jgi:MFS family permease
MAEQTSTPKRVPRTVKVLGIVSFLNDISSEMVYPVIPIFLTSVLGAPIAVVGFIEGIAEATASLLKSASGWWSDRIRRRKPFVVLGYGLSTIAKPLFALAYTWPVVLVGRLIDRFGKGVRTSARDAWIADVTPAEIRGRSFGLHRTLDTLGAIAGPFFAAWFFRASPGQYRTLFLIAFVPGFLAIFLLAAAAKEERQQPTVLPGNNATSQSGWRNLPRSFWVFVGFSLLFGLANSSDAFLILRGKSLGWSTAAAILGYAVYNSTYALGSYPAGILSDRIPRRFILAAGLMVFAAAYAAFGLLSGTTVLWFLFALYGISVALTEATSRALVADMAPKEIYGAAYGMYGALISISNLIASAWFGLVWQLMTPKTAFSISAILAITAAVGLMCFLQDPKAVRN